MTTVSGVHPSFSFEHKLASDELHGSSTFDNLYVRVFDRDEIPKRDYEAGLTTDDCTGQMQTLMTEINHLEDHGVEVAGRSGLVLSNNGETTAAIVCKKLTGNTIEHEVKNGNTDAASAFAQTMVGVTGYLVDAIDADRDTMADITGMNQFTWEQGNVILHDISTIENQTGTLMINEATMFKVNRADSALRECAAALTQLCIIEPMINAVQIKGSLDNAQKASEIKDHRHPEYGTWNSQFFIDLVGACLDNPRALKLLAMGEHSGAITLETYHY